MGAELAPAGGAGSGRGGRSLRFNPGELNHPLSPGFEWNRGHGSPPQHETVLEEKQHWSHNTLNPSDGNPKSCSTARIGTAIPKEAMPRLAQPVTPLGSLCQPSRTPPQGKAQCEATLLEGSPPGDRHELGLLSAEHRSDCSL